MKKKRHGKTFMAAFLCACLLMTGSVQPFYARASLDDEIVEEGGEGLDGSGDASADAGHQEEAAVQANANAVEEGYQDEIAAINSKLDKLADEKKALEASIANAKGEKEKKQAEANAINREISITQNEIALLQERISVLTHDILLMEEHIEAKQEDIEAKQEDFDAKYELFRKRVRAKYMQDTTSTLELLVGSQSFSELLVRTEYVRRIAQHDRDLMDTLEEQRMEMEDEKQQLEDEKQQLEETKSSIEDDKAETEDKKSILGTQVTKVNQQVQDIEQMEREYLADLENKKKIEDAAKAELNRIFQEIEWSKNPYVGGEMAWPAPGLYTFTSEYGSRFGGSDFHTGIDISGGNAYGKPVVAANAGTVVTANWNYVAGQGYGIYIILDHGGKTSTLYGHLSNISVNVGDVVNKGQTIGSVGSTGWSTGPHLHFEVRIDGKAVNPKSYIVGSQG